MPPPRSCHLLVFATAYTTFVVYGSFVPLEFRSVDGQTAWNQMLHMPLLDIGLNGRADLVANLLLFIPLSFLWFGAIALDRRRWCTIVAAFGVVPACAALSLAIECVQIWLPRTVSLNDVLAESAGALVGTTLWVFLGPSLISWMRTYTTDLRPARQIDWLLQAYCLGFLVYSLMPLDLTISLGELAEKYQSGKVRIVPFSYPYATWFDLVVRFATDAIVFAPVGALVATTLTSPGRRVRPFGRSTLTVAATAAGIEAAQFFVYSRVVDTTDIILGAVGGMGGVWIANRFVDPTGDVRGAVQARDRVVPREIAWALTALLYTLLLVVRFWYPFDFTSDQSLIRERLDTFFAIPLVRLYYGTEFNSLRQILIRLLLYAPLGAMLTRIISVRDLPDGARWVMASGIVAVCSAVALGIELGQVLLPSHVADFSEVLFCAAGAALGVAVTLRLERGWKQSLPATSFFSAESAQITKDPDPEHVVRSSCGVPVARDRASRGIPESR